MAFLPLPLQTRIQLRIATSLENKVRIAQFKGGTSEQKNEVINPNIYSWVITYMPLTKADKTTVFDFLMEVGSSKYFLYDDGCTPTTTYTVRMTKDSLKIKRKQAKYLISFKLEEQIYT